jgi:endogenous inhibitor of DNA gyrase (YacG/DUF329 family)
MTRSSKTPVCAICGQPQAAAYRPFCSRRCADVDLQRWLSGAYVAPRQADESHEPPPRTDEED